MAYLIETFNIGTGMGQNPPETYLQDSILGMSYVPLIQFNSVNQLLGQGFFTHDPTTRRLNFNSPLNDGDIIIVHFFKY